MAKLEISKVHDAYAEGGECPLCGLMLSVERTYLLSFQGSRVMEPNVRVQTNKLGFCPDHYRRLYQGENKQGLSLVVHTHFKEIIPALEKRLDEAASPPDRPGRAAKAKAGGPVEALLELLNALDRSCFICEMLASDLERYAFTIIYLWKGDADFLPIFKASNGFCVEHLAAVIAQARGMLKPGELSNFIRDVGQLMKKRLDTLENDLFQFTQLFRDENRSLGTDQVRSALIRTLQKLSSGRVGGP